MGSGWMVDLKEGPADMARETKCVMNVRAARILPFKRYLVSFVLVSYTGSEIVSAHGMVPRMAKGPGDDESAPCHHSNIICANNRALSRFPAARRCGSARSKAPSDGIMKSTIEKGSSGARLHTYPCTVAHLHSGADPDLRMDNRRSLRSIFYFRLAFRQV